jgi:1-acyl-sn-glycerol-3-phosphate acyltransferase
MALYEWLKKFRQYKENCVKPGFIPPLFWRFRTLARFLSRIWVYIQVGKVNLIGGENLQRPDRYIFCPNHRCMLDAQVLYAILNRDDVYYMGAYEEMLGFWGLKGAIMSASGAFPVDREKGKEIIPSAVQLLVNGKCLSIFPEGKISATGECFPFKMGPAVIGFRALNELRQMGKEERIGLVPIHLDYHKTDNATAVKRYIQMGFKWRGGITITVGEPIYLNDFVDTNQPGLPMGEVEKFVCRTQTRAQALGCPC